MKTLSILKIFVWNLIIDSIKTLWRLIKVTFFGVVFVATMCTLGFGVVSLFGFIIVEWLGINVTNYIVLEATLNPYYVNGGAFLLLLALFMSFYFLGTDIISILREKWVIAKRKSKNIN